MLIVALVLAVVSLASLVTAVVTSNDVLAWVCIGLSALGVLLLIVDAIRDRTRRALEVPAESDAERTEVMEPVTAAAATAVIGPALGEHGETGSRGAGEDYPEDVGPDEIGPVGPEHDLPGDDGRSAPVAAEGAGPEHADEEEADAPDDVGATWDGVDSTGVESTGDTTASIVYASESSAADSYIVIYPGESDTLEADVPEVDQHDESADSPVNPELDALEELSEAEEPGDQ